MQHTLGGFLRIVNGWLATTQRVIAAGGKAESGKSCEEVLIQSKREGNRHAFKNKSWSKFSADIIWGVK